MIGARAAAVRRRRAAAAGGLGWLVAGRARRMVRAPLHTHYHCCYYDWWWRLLVACGGIFFPLVNYFFFPNSSLANRDLFSGPCCLLAMAAGGALHTVGTT